MIPVLPITSSSSSSSSNLVVTLIIIPSLIVIFLFIQPSNSTALPPSSPQPQYILGIAKYKPHYQDSIITQPKFDPSSPQSYKFSRFQSPTAIFQSLPQTKFHHHSKDEYNRTGFISHLKLKNDYLLVQSKQVAYGVNSEEVLKAYLNETLQMKYNGDDLLDCKFYCRDILNIDEEDESDESDDINFSKNEVYSHVATEESINKRKLKGMGSGLSSLLQRQKRQIMKRLIDQQEEYAIKNINTCNPSSPKIDTQYGKYYQQILTLHSQRIIAKSTGIMKYKQNIFIDQIGNDNYSVIVQLDEDDQNRNHDNDEEVDGNNFNNFTTTKCKPFDSLLVHVTIQQEKQGNEQNQKKVNIYANGIMKVNRNVIPDLILFDTRGIAGTMAGRGTLWLSGYFEEQRLLREKEEGVKRELL